MRRRGAALMVRRGTADGDPKRVRAQVSKRALTRKATLKKKPTRTLSDLKPGESATIAETPTANERLAEIGFVKGERVEVIRFAPLGDPVMIQVLDTPVIIRRADLAEVLVD